MDVAITGASGLIGSALRAGLEADGHRVLPLVRRPVEPDEPAVSWDPARGHIDGDALEGVGAVVHLAGEGIAERRWSDEQKRRILESRTKGTELLANALAQLDTPPGVLLSGSAIGFYGARGDEVLTEASAAGDDFLADVCRSWEAAAAPAVDAGIRTAFLRTGIVLSADGGALAKMLPLFKAFLGGRLGSGSQWWSWVSVRDEVGAIRFLLDADVAGPVNITGPTPVTNRDFTAALGSVLGRPTALPVPAFGPKLLLGGELAEALLFTSQRVVPAVLESAGYDFADAHVEGALRTALGR